MKFRGTLGGLNIQLGTEDTPQSVAPPLQARRSLLASGVILEIDNEVSPATLDAVRAAIEEAGGEVLRLRAPRVAAPPPTPSSPTPNQGGQQTGPSAEGQGEQAGGQDPAQEAITESLTPEPVVVSGNIRAGFRGEYAGSVVVLGDVNPGAELVAGGDIIVLGSLRGVVHAGADGREDAIVWARPIASAQIRIAGAVARAPQGSSLGTMKRLGNTSEVARLQQGQIVIERSHTPPLAR